ncbi:MAG: hypothetical protein F6K38_39835 [Moorea sp. SIO3B2]|nr:hypothetical protein [Moorena sp. SIO3B2]
MRSHSRFPITDSRFPIPDSRFPIPDSRKLMVRVRLCISRIIHSIVVLVCGLKPSVIFTLWVVVFRLVAKLIKGFYQILFDKILYDDPYCYKHSVEDTC